MKKYILLWGVLAGIFSFGMTAFASVTNSANFQLSVTIPPHVQPTALDAAAISNAKGSSVDSDPEQQVLIEQELRHNETITIQTITLK